MGRVAVFIDGAYLEHAMREWFDYARVDFRQLAEWLAEPHDLLRVHYYHCLPYLPPDPSPDERERLERKRSFFHALEHIPRFSVRLGELQAHQNAEGATITHQKQVDVRLSIDFVLLASRRVITDAVLVAGDGDFVPAVAAAQGEGVVVHLVHGPRYSDQLWQQCDERREILPEHIHRFRLRSTDRPQPADSGDEAPAAEHVFADDGSGTSEAAPTAAPGDVTVASQGDDGADGTPTSRENGAKPAPPAAAVQEETATLGTFHRRLVNGVIKAENGESIFVPEGIVRGLNIHHGDLVLASEEGELPNGRPRYYYTVVERSGSDNGLERQEVAGVIQKEERDDGRLDYLVPDGPRRVYIPGGDLDRWGVTTGDLVTVAFNPLAFEEGSSWTHGRIVERHELHEAAGAGGRDDEAKEDLTD